MYNVVGVVLNGKGKTYYFSTNSIELKKGDNVIVETEKGLQFGQVVVSPYDVSEEDIVCVVTEAIKDYEMMKSAAESKGIPYFSYYSIAERAIAAK